MFIIRHISIARTRKLPRYLTTILYILFAITIEFTKSNPLFAKENTYAKIIKCSPNEKREHCVIQLSKDINNILFNSQVLKVNFFHLGKIIFHIDPQFTKRINKKNLFHAKVFWQISNKEKEQMIRKNPSFSMRIKYKKISSLKPNTARQSFTPQKQGSYIIYQFLSRNITSIAIIFFLIFIGYRIFKSNKASKKASKEYKNTIKKDLHLPHTLHPIINPYLCAGCGSCVKACPEGEIIKLINHKAVLVNPTKCVGHSLCAAMCPYDAIDLVFGSKEKPKQIPLVSENYETNVSGLYIAGELGGMGLIANAVRQGTLAALDALKSIQYPHSCDVDMLIVGAGPAGLAMACVAASKNINYLVIEQNSFGGTINNFPRGKLVMNRPCDFYGYGKTKFSSHRVSKESLLHTWYDIKTKMNLEISEQTKFLGLIKENDHFKINTDDGILTAQKVMLAMGVGGSPRKLGLKNEDSEKVSYRLIDAADFQNMNIAIVGGGNSALEAAQYLSDSKYKNRVTLLVRKDMRKANQINQDLVTKIANKGRLRIIYNAAITAIEKDKIEIKYGRKSTVLLNDHIFVFAGTVMPWDFLTSLGIKIEIKRGESNKWDYTPEEDHNRYKVINI